LVGFFIHPNGGTQTPATASQEAGTAKI